MMLIMAIFPVVIVNNVGAEMAEVAVKTKGEAKATARADGLTKYENPTTITQHFVNNILSASEKIYSKGDKPDRAKDQLIDLLEDLAEDEKENSKESIFKGTLDKAQGYLDQGVNVAKMKNFLDNTAKEYAVAYSKSNLPTDRTEFTAILQAAVSQAVDTYAASKKLAQANLGNKDIAEDVSVPATQVSNPSHQAASLEK